MLSHVTVVYKLCIVRNLGVTDYFDCLSMGHVLTYVAMITTYTFLRSRHLSWGLGLDWYSGFGWLRQSRPYLLAVCQSLGEMDSHVPKVVSSPTKPAKKHCIQKPSETESFKLPFLPGTVHTSEA